MGYIGTAPLSGDYRKLDDISSGFNASETAFALQVGSVNVTPPKATAVLISVGGILQEPVTAYDISGSTITFTAAPAAGADFFGVMLGAGVDVGSPGDDTVTGAKIADGAVDSEHIVAGAIDVAHMSINSVDSDQYVDGSIDVAHMSVNSVDSDQYVDGSIDTGHIADNQVTLAKVADIARGSLIVGNASAATAELTKGGAATVLTSDGTDIAWAAAGGITEVDSWRLYASFTTDGSFQYLTSNLERDDTQGFGKPGTGMTQSSGVFTFPSTGYWRVNHHTYFTWNGATGSSTQYLMHTANGAAGSPTWVAAASPAGLGVSGKGGSTASESIFLITDLSNHKISFATITQSGGSIVGVTDRNYTYFTFTRLAPE